MPNSILVYRADEYSFDVEPALSAAFTSVLLDDLNLEIDVEGRVLSVWGMCPHTRWKETVLIPPRAEAADIFFHPDTPLSKGVSIRFNNNKYWPVLVDTASGWVCVKGSGIAGSAAQILPGIIIEVTNEGDILAIWLHPDKLPELAS